MGWQLRTYGKGIGMMEDVVGFSVGERVLGLWWHYAGHVARVDDVPSKGALEVCSLVARESVVKQIRLGVEGTWADFRDTRSRKRPGLGDLYCHGAPCSCADEPTQSWRQSNVTQIFSMRFFHKKMCRSASFRRRPPEDRSKRRQGSASPVSRSDRCVRLRVVAEQVHW